MFDAPDGHQEGHPACKNIAPLISEGFIGRPYVFVVSNPC